MKNRLKTKIQMKNQINLAIQVLPSSANKHPYDLVDGAIETIKASGLKYQVCPFETVIEGPYDEVMDLVKKVQMACYCDGADSLIVNIKIQSNANKDVFILDKMEKYQ